MSFVDLVILLLACWRLAHLITRDDGPGRLLAATRERIAGDDPADGSLGQLVTCPYCMGMWVGMLLAGCYYQWPRPTVAGCLAFALAGGVSLLEQLTFDRQPAAEWPPELPVSPPGDMLEG